MTELLTVPEAASLLRTSPKAVYALVERGQIPGVTRLGRRVLIQQAALRKHLGLTAVPQDAHCPAAKQGSERDHER